MTDHNASILSFFTETYKDIPSIGYLYTRQSDITDFPVDSETITISQLNDIISRLETDAVYHSIQSDYYMVDFKRKNGIEDVLLHSETRFLQKKKRSSLKEFIFQNFNGKKAMFHKDLHSILLFKIHVLKSYKHSKEYQEKISIGEIVEKKETQQMGIVYKMLSGAELTAQEKDLLKE